MSDAALRPLPKGRHQLSRAEVEASQRLRLAVALADALAVDGFAKTPVATILEGAGVSRQTFYTLYDDKLACFLDALDLVGDVLLQELDAVPAPDDGPLDRAIATVDRYLDALAGHPTFARLYLVEVHAAGRTALIRRAALQARVVDGLASLLGAERPADRFACEAFVAAVGSLVTVPIVTADENALRALRAPLVGLLTELAQQIDRGPADR